MENNTITIPMDEYKELVRKAVCFDILRELSAKAAITATWKTHFSGLRKIRSRHNDSENINSRYEP